MPLDECPVCGVKVSMALLDRIEHMKNHGYDFSHLMYQLPMVVEK